MAFAGGRWLLLWCVLYATLMIGLRLLNYVPEGTA